ncbi:MAG: EamA family transporter RarD [Planctomycetota bacterium]|nr:EamA family transporter RarD [Planctomycetota bacterium]
MSERSETSKGLWATTAAFAIWGLVPIYWKAVSAIPPREMITYRVLWALPFLALILKVWGGWRHVGVALKRPRIIGLLALSAALVGFNWFVFIEAVNDGQIMQASLGYYINPLVNVLLGFVLLGERMRKLQWCAVALAAAGVGVLIVEAGEIPLVALALAFSFGLYGLVRKLAPIDAMPGLFVEVVLLTPLAGVWLGLQLAGGTTSQVGLGTWLLVPLAGLITALPLGWFSYGARRLTLATVGILQFLAPTGQFLLATLVYGEPFTHAHVITFALIWAGVGVYLVDLLRRGQTSPA